MFEIRYPPGTTNVESGTVQHLEKNMKMRISAECFLRMGREVEVMEGLS